jgi:spore germination protein YaaH
MFQQHIHLREIALLQLTFLDKVALMLGRNGNYIKIAATNGTNVNPVLTNMYSNTNNAFTDVTLKLLGKQLKTKLLHQKTTFNYSLVELLLKKYAVQSFETQLSLANKFREQLLLQVLQVLIKMELVKDFLLQMV